SDQVLCRQFYVGRIVGCRNDRSDDHHWSEAALRRHRCRSRVELRRDAFLGCESKRSTLREDCDCSVRCGYEETLRSLHQADDAAATKIAVAEWSYWDGGSRRACPFSDSRSVRMDSKQLLQMTRRQFVTTTTAGMTANAVLGNTTMAGLTVQMEKTGNTAPSRVIIDTDPGVDDALALLLALRSPELKIEAITPVAGNVPLSLTLPNALRMVEIAGRTDIPVAPGAEGPLFRRLVSAAYVHGENGLGGAVFP